jgi:hypothetical protein
MASIRIPHERQCLSVYFFYYFLNLCGFTLLSQVSRSGKGSYTKERQTRQPLYDCFLPVPSSLFLSSGGLVAGGWYDFQFLGMTPKS